MVGTGAVSHEGAPSLPCSRSSVSRRRKTADVLHRMPPRQREPDAAADPLDAMDKPEMRALVRQLELECFRATLRADYAQEEARCGRARERFYRLKLSQMIRATG